MAKVLVVEDDSVTSELLAANLRRNNHRVLTAGNAQEALAIVGEKGAPEVVVLDVGLPDMNGRDLLVALRKLPFMDNVPAIFLSGHIEEDDVEKGRALGALYLTKPFVRSALLDAIERSIPAKKEVAGGW